MTPDEYWKNFNLGEELSISGTFIYNGIRRFHEIRKLDHTDDIFEILYNLSVGMERLFKIAVVLLEHEPSADQAALEESLLTHSHTELLGRVKRHHPLNIGSVHSEFLALLGTFYKAHRYNRFTLDSVHDPKKERDALRTFLSKHLGIELEHDNSPFGVFNDDRYRSFLRKVVTKISNEVYRLIEARAQELNLYTYELRHSSKAQTVFLGNADLFAEDVLWKELLIFFMNTKEISGYLRFLQGIEPLPFDPALVGDYLECFRSHAAAVEVVDELEAHYEVLEHKGERLEIMSIIASPSVDFPDESDEDRDFDGRDASSNDQV
jgi:hypothetical protein